MKIPNPLRSTIEKSAVEGARDGARAILKRSRELSPEDAGGLKKEGRVSVDDLTVQVSYDSIKALKNHEDLDYHHDDGGPKFLERAADEIDVEQYIARRLARDLGG